MKASRRILALLMSLLLCISLLPVPVFAEDTSSADFGEAAEVTEPSEENEPAEENTPAQENDPEEAAGESAAEEILPDSEPAEPEEGAEEPVEEETVANDQALATAHSHPVCGASCTHLNSAGTATIKL